MAAEDIVGIHITGRYQAQNVVNTLHYRVKSQTVDDHVLLQILVAAWDVAMTTAWLARHIDTYELVGLRGFSKSGNNKRPGILAIGDPGVVTGEETPSPVCRVITLYTDSTNYRRHGRVMLSGSDTTMFNTTDGAVTDVEQAALVALGVLLITDVEDGGDVFEPSLPPTATLPVEQLTAALPRKTPSCIRSRRVRAFSVG